MMNPPCAGGCAGGKGFGAFLEAGDWLCPSCGDHQFKRNNACRKCGAPNPHRSSDSADSQLECSLHGKRRTAKNLEPDGMGGMRCVAGSECQTSGKGKGGYGGFNMMQQMQQMQQMQAFMKGGAGFMEGGADWGESAWGPPVPQEGWGGGKGGAPTSFRELLAQPGKGGGKNEHAEQFENFMTSMIAESNWMSSMEGGMGAMDGMGACAGFMDCGKGFGKKGKSEIEAGDWLCPGCGDHQFKRNNQCRKCGTPNPNMQSRHLSDPQARCSAHGKMRTMKNLEPDGMGGMVCSPASQCQTGGAGGSFRFSPF